MNSLVAKGARCECAMARIEPPRDFRAESRCAHFYADGLRFGLRTAGVVCQRCGGTVFGLQPFSQVSANDEGRRVVGGGK